MKRYTGQKALYEAISRSRAKAKRGNILERFLPEAVKQEKPGLPEEPLPVEPEAAPVDQAAAVVSEPPQALPVPEKPREPAVVKRNAKLRRFGKVEPVGEKPAVPQSKPAVVEKIDPPAPPRRVQAWWRAKPVQWHMGRIEISMPYHIAVVVALVLVLVVLAAFRLGQKYPGSKPRGAGPAALGSPAAGAPAAQPTRGDTPASVRGSEPAAPPKDNWIVVAKHKQKEELEPVKEYFDKNDIELTIVPLADARKEFTDRGLNVAALPRGDGFLLVSALCSNPKSPGTDGYAMWQKIVELGKKYKAPPGRETFAPNYFQDVYGMKITK
jgi:hypothetical protein